MKAYRYISDERRKKADSLSHPLGKQRSVGAGYLMALGLHEAGLSPYEERIFFSTHGKPYLPDHPNVHFNVSHSGSYVVCAFSDVTVGIDIEEIKDIQPHLVKFVMNKKELSMYESMNDADKKIFFYENWTGKEAFLKHIAKGLTLRPSEIYSSCREKIESLNFYIWHDIPGYIINLCTANERPELTEVRL